MTDSACQCGATYYAMHVVQVNTGYQEHAYTGSTWLLAEED